MTISFDLKLVRDHLISMTPKTAHTLYSYGYSNVKPFNGPDVCSTEYETRLAYYTVSNLAWTIAQTASILKNEPNIDILHDLVKVDLGIAQSHVCLAAWLTIDGFRWSTIFPDLEDTFEYSLILQYPEFTTTFCKYLYFPHYRPRLETTYLSNEELEEALQLSTMQAVRESR
jgi:hypothetical protein